MKLQDINGSVIDVKECNVVFSKDIDQDMIALMIEDITNREEPIVNLYWSSHGGCLSALEIAVDFVKNSEKFFNIKVLGQVYSAGVGFLERVKDFDNVVISKVANTAIVMVHECESFISTRDMLNQHTLSHFLSKGGEIINETWRELNIGVLTESEVADFDKGLDIWISPERYSKHLGIPYNDDDASVALFEDRAKEFFTAEEEYVLCDISFSENDMNDIEEEFEVKRIRGFEPVGDTYIKEPGVPYQKPVRSTSKSAGYDIFSTRTIVLAPGERVVVPTDVKAYMLPDEVLKLYVRSSAGIKKGLALQNGTGIIDADYYSNPDNDGNIGVPLVNTLEFPVEIKVGERIAQVVFQKFLVADDDDASGERVGGTGSTGV
ncbi:MAG: dCTP deaminase domain-containing protein [Bacteroidales bacterium]